MLNTVQVKLSTLLIEQKSSAIILLQSTKIIKIGYLLSKLHSKYEYFDLKNENYTTK